MISSLLIRQSIYEECGSPKLNSLQDLSDFFAAAKAKHPELVCLGMNIYSWGLRALLDQIGVEIVGYSAVLREGTDFPNDKLYYLNELPIFVG